MMELCAKLIEKDDTKKNDILKALSYYNRVDVVVLDDQIQITFEGGQNDSRTFAELMRICEACECHMFRMKQR